MTLSIYDSYYKNQEAAFGEHEAPLLGTFCHLIPPGGTVLDIGVGQGRNSLFLARQGYEVTGIDPSAEGIRQTQKKAQQEDLPLNLNQVGLEAYEPSKTFDAILLFGLLQEFTPTETRTCLNRIHEWLKPQGHFFMVAWNPQDPRYLKHKEAGKHLGPHSFELPDGKIRSYFETKEILQLFPEWTVPHRFEGLGPRHHHGDGVMEQHGDLELILRKPPPQGPPEP